jgi:hypothetical protein
MRVAVNDHIGAIGCEEYGVFVRGIWGVEIKESVLACHVA